MPIPEEVMHRLAAAHHDALRVSDQPLRASQVAASLVAIAQMVARSDAPADLLWRVREALSDAERALRSNDDGREAANHILTAIRLADDRIGRLRRA